MTPRSSPVTLDLMERALARLARAVLRPKMMMARDAGLSPTMAIEARRFLRELHDRQSGLAHAARELLDALAEAVAAFGMVDLPGPMIAGLSHLAGTPAEQPIPEERILEMLGGLTALAELLETSGPPSGAPSGAAPDAPPSGTLARRFADGTRFYRSLVDLEGTVSRGGAPPPSPDVAGLASLATQYGLTTPANLQRTLREQEEAYDAGLGAGALETAAPVPADEPTPLPQEASALPVGAPPGTRLAARVSALIAVGLLVGGALSVGFYLSMVRARVGAVETRQSGTGNPSTTELAVCASRQTRLNTAIEAYHTRTAEWPGSLLDLVPSEMPSLPGCPVDGSAYGYDHMTRRVICPHGHNP